MNDNYANKLIKENFKNEANLLKFFADLCQLQEEENGATIDIDFKNYSSDGYTTGIIISAIYADDTFKLNVITEGYHRYFTTDENITYTILDAQKRFLSDCDVNEKDFFEKFEFLIRKPFLINITDNIVDYLIPINPELYNDCFPLFLKLMEE